MQQDRSDEARRALRKLLAAIEDAPVGFRPPHALTPERVEAGRAWLEELRALGKAVRELVPEHRAARLRTFRDQLDEAVEQTSVAAPPGWADGIRGPRPRVERALQAVPLAINALGSAAREVLDALDREDRLAEARPAEAKHAAADTPSGPIRLHVALADLQSTHGETPKQRARVRVRVEHPGRPLADHETSYRKWREVEAAAEKGKGFAPVEPERKRAARLVEMLEEWGLTAERDGDRVRLPGVRIVRVDDWDPSATLSRVLDEGARREAGGRPRR